MSVLVAADFAACSGIVVAESRADAQPMKKDEMKKGEGKDGKKAAKKGDKKGDKKGAKKDDKK